jgi:S1-C subfamily serine protease
MICCNCNKLVQGRPSICPFCDKPIAFAEAPVPPAVPGRESYSCAVISVEERINELRNKYGIKPYKPRNAENEHNPAARMFDDKKDKVAVIKTETGVGTGFFLPNGMIGTNAHVIAAEENTPARSIQAVHMDRVYDMVVHNVDFEQDIAILKFKGRGPDNIDKYINRVK